MRTVAWLGTAMVCLLAGVFVTFQVVSGPDAEAQAFEPKLRVGGVARIIGCSGGARMYPHSLVYSRPPRRPPWNFFFEVVDPMQRYRTRTGRFPSEWFLLNWPYEESWSYEHDDISLLPTPSMGNAWTPSLSKYTYVIRTATHDELLVQAIDIQDGDVVAEMDQAYITSDRETGFRQLRDYTCYKEDASPWRPTDAARFLRRLANAFDGFYHKCRHYPDTFDDVELHVAIGRHTENDPIAIPPKGAARWKPHGFAYTFTILRSGNHFLVQSSNDEGLEDYFVTDQTPPTLLKSGGRTP